MEDEKKQGEEKNPAIPHQQELIPNEILKTMPPDVQKQFKQMEVFASMTRGPVNPLFEKMKPEHVSQFLEMLDKDSEREYGDTRSNRRFLFAAFCIAVLLFAFLTVFFMSINQASMLTQILTIAIALAGGFGGGYGFSKSGRKGR
jgi:Flp pilus assembly protein TadB